MNDDKKVWNQYIKGFPITVDILKIINDMRGFDVVIICMYDINDTNEHEEISQLNEISSIIH